MLHDDLDAIAAGLAVSARTLPLDQHEPTRRYTRVLATASYDAWVIAWSPSAELDVHDHAGSTAAVHVVEGELVERRTDLVTGRSLGVRTVRGGQTIRVAPTIAHGVANYGPGDALSVHVYSPPLTGMTFYQQTATGLEMVSVAR
jgi:quercetin dioxygenase-like cupin family protein